MIYGKGINDADYPVRTNVNGLYQLCPFYSVWKGMLKRCYCTSKKSSHVTYENITVSNEWLRFSNFREWMIQRDWKGKQLDKDLLCNGSNLYSEKSCIFISKAVNVFLNMNQRTNSPYLGGVSLSSSGKFTARGKEFGKSVYLGSFDSEIAAHRKYINHKLGMIDKITDDCELKVMLVNYVNSKREDQYA